MKLYEDLIYVGTNEKILMHGDGYWHCTCFLSNLSDDKMFYAIQQPLYVDGKVYGYTNLNAYVISEEELTRDFKIVKNIGMLIDIENRSSWRTLKDTELDELIKKIEAEEGIVD
ncbi:hypothetical protein D3C81_09520 [compost metagenome]